MFQIRIQAFSGKEPSKVDRSAAYMLRYIAKNLVAGGLISEIKIGISYAIGECNPTSLVINNFKMPKKINLTCNDFIKMIYDLFDLTPKGIIKLLDLRKQIYLNCSNYGHFNNQEMP